MRSDEAQDAQTKLLLYTQTDIQRAESDEQILAFMDFWTKVWRGVGRRVTKIYRTTDRIILSRLVALVETWWVDLLHVFSKYECISGTI